MAASANAGFGLRGPRSARERFLYILQQPTQPARGVPSDLRPSAPQVRWSTCRCQSGQQVQRGQYVDGCAHALVRMTGSKRKYSQLSMEGRF
jgi:hypothetical protein